MISGKTSRRLASLACRPVAFCLFLALSCSSSSATQTATSQSQSHLLRIQELYKAGMALVEQQQFGEAIRDFEQGLRLDPNNQVLMNALGATWTLKGDAERARGYFRRVLEIEPTFMPARKNLAISYFDSGKYDLAVREFERLSRNPEAAPVAHLFLGMIADERAQYDKAITAFQDSGDLVYQYSRALLSFARSLFELNQGERAQAVLDRLGDASGVSSAEFFQSGVLRLHYGQYKQAAQIFDKIELSSDQAREIRQELEAKRPDGDSLNLLARVAIKTGEIDLAVKALRKAAELEPNLEEHYLDFSTICLDYGNYSLALEIAEVGLSHIPRSYRLLVQKGAVLDKQRRHEEALQVLRSAVDLRKDNSEARRSLGVAEAHAHQFDDAIKTLTAGVEAFPDDYYMHYYLGVVLLASAEQQDMSPEIAEHAQQALERAITLNPAFADSYYQLGKLYKDKAPGIAAAKLETCLRVDPKNTSAAYELGRLYLKMGRKGEGESLLRRFATAKDSEKLEEERKPRLESTR